MRNSETGRASKLQGFANLIIMTEGMANYAPPTEDLQLEHLNVVRTKAETAHQAVSEATALCQEARGIRNTAMQPLNRTVNSIKDLIGSMGLSNDVNEGVKSLCYSITGNKKLSQLGFDARIDHFSQLIDVLKGQTKYNPNRTELQVNSLEAMRDGLLKEMQNVNTCEIALKSAQREQKEAFSGETGLYGITRRVKLYLKSIFGTRSPEYKAVVRITKVITS